MKRDWKQDYFYLVESHRDKQGKPRQHSLYLGKTLSLSAQEWVAVLDKVEDGILTRGDVHVHGAVRAYCKKNGLPLNTADAVRAAAKIVRKAAEEKELEAMRRSLESQQRWQREHPEEARRVRERGEALKNMFVGGSDKVSRAARLLGVSLPVNRDEVQTAFREMARANHPDSGGDAAKFRETVEARDTLFNHLGTTQSESVVTR